MRIWQIITVSAAAGVTLPALAQMTPPAPPAQTRADVEAKVRDRLGRFDADKNGTVTPEEMKSYAETRMKARNDDRFAAMDTDKNGAISRAEFDTHHKGGMMAMGHRGHHAMGQGMGEGDRVVQIERRKRGGPDGAPSADGKPVVKERTRIMMMGGREGMMMMQGDGKGIVIADAVKKALERFDAADADKDGKIGPEERKAQRGAWRMKIG
jgi:hypothetical protein